MTYKIERFSPPFADNDEYNKTSEYYSIQPPMPENGIGDPKTLGKLIGAQSVHHAFTNENVTVVEIEAQQRQAHALDFVAANLGHVLNHFSAAPQMPSGPERC